MKLKLSPKRAHRNHPIRPAPLREQALIRPGAASLFPSLPVSVPAKRRGPQTTLACDACRLRKTKCDGRRPCEACKIKSSQCHYDKEGREKNKTSVLRSQVADLRAIVKRLSDASDEEAAEIRRRLKDTTDVSKIVKDFCAVSTVGDVSDTERSTTPESISSSTQKLPSIDFLTSPHSDDSHQDRLPTRLELFKIARQRAVLDTVSLEPDHDNGELNFSISIPRPSYFPTPFQQIPSVRKPNLEFSDRAPSRPILSTPPFLSINSHPLIPVSDMSLSRLLCLWLSYHAFINPYMQPTEFISSFDPIRDKSNRGQLLLQQATLALSCNGAGESTVMADHFSGEVERLWYSERGLATISNVQGLLARYEYEKLVGRDRVGWHSLRIGIDMGQSIGLHSTHTQFDCSSSTDSEAFAAWGIYNLQAIESLTYCKPPQVIRCWTERPKRIFPSRITDVWQPYCLDTTQSSSSFWDHWEALCSLSDIIVDATNVLFGDQLDGFELPGPVLIAQTQHSRFRLSEWRQNLPENLSLSQNETPHNLWLHMAYYSAMIALHRPYVEEPAIASSEPRDVILHSRNIMIESARNIVRLAAISIEHYTLEFSPAQSISMVGTALFILLSDLDDSASRCHLLSAVKILQLQSHRFPLAAALARVAILLAKRNVSAEAVAVVEIEKAFQDHLNSQCHPLQQTDLKPEHNLHRLAGRIHSNFPTFVEAGRYDTFSGRKSQDVWRRAGGYRLSEVLISLEGQI